MGETLRAFSFILSPDKANSQPRPPRLQGTISWRALLRPRDTARASRSSLVGEAKSWRVRRSVQLWGQTNWVNRGLAIGPRRDTTPTTRTSQQSSRVIYSTANTPTGSALRFAPLTQPGRLSSEGGDDRGMGVSLCSTWRLISDTQVGSSGSAFGSRLSCLGCRLGPSHPLNVSS